MSLIGKAKLLLLKSFGLSNEDIVNVSKIKKGFDEFAKTNQTPSESYLSMINLFCSTKGYSNEFIHFFISKKYPKIKLENHEGTLGTKSIADVRKIADAIKRDGYFVFKNGITRKVAEYLYDYGINNEASVLPLETNNGPLRKEKINLNDPVTIRYTFSEEDLINDPTIQELMTDNSILSVAQEYLGCMPRADGTNMWWHTDYSNEPNEEAATMWHFDMDRVKWLKFFFYLTDVTTETGPHCFIKGSHRIKGIPDDLLKKGYSRITDEEVEKYYTRDRILEYIAEKGTVIAEDTRGLHKGKPVIKGARLIFQMQFSDHLFGASLPNAKFSNKFSPRVETLIKDNKDIYARYLEA
ncbi:phytanoyl-CoA dioxygenase family protein [Leptospira ilyithenensis]|uniref:Phytanoyl-CoA dioxygenase n=1 Tax=Leptospira ilyithenensis TaxID=2484901 RepID=A0A4R9LM35_9LEPT|nr:phytanoyl-CoA dioxygenase family protein [Leptospira ilyithenensis]TGN08014.1 phytanoyl-CoA dioxygenase [Leptospira ilyithenensis]